MTLMHTLTQNHNAPHPPSNFPFLDSDERIWLIGGPPGTGKTTWAEQNLAEALRRGMSGSNITVCAFTRTAAFEVRRRINQLGLDIPEENVGTLHALAYHALQKPSFALSKTVLDEWNELHPMWALSALTEGEDLEKSREEKGQGKAGDGLLQQVGRLRNEQVPLTDSRWDPVRSFYNSWTPFKEGRLVMDFPDIIEAATGSTMPPGAMMLMVDEYQDISPLERNLVSWWSEMCEKVALIGDDDQAIYGALKGATAQAFLQQPEGTQYLVLHQSYRVPRQVHSVAMGVIGRIPQEKRWVKTYLPRDAEGEVDHLSSTFQDPFELGKLLQGAEQEGSSTMVLGYAHYMLEGTIALMRQLGILYHNPYRPTQGHWNPVGGKRKGTVSTLERVCAFARPNRTHRDLALFGSILNAKGVLLRGKKKELEDEMDLVRASDQHGLEPLDEGNLALYFTPEALPFIQAGDLEWFRENTKASSSMDYLIKLVKKRGPEVHLLKPSVVIGTIHSVKGAEADDVVVFPDVPEGARDHDEVCRVFYVALTRARNRLLLAAPHTENHFRFPDVS